MKKTQAVSVSPLKYFFIIGLVVMGGWFVKNHVETNRIECHMFHGTLVKGTCIFPR